MPSSLYPPSPTINNYSFLEPSDKFKQHVYAMISGIAMFILLYVVLIVLGFLLLISCCYLGIGLISLHPSFITLAAGLGLIALGIMFFLFLIKFVFSRTDEADPLQIEIKPQDHPELFSFIKQITKEVKTDFPKKIFLTPDVNAAIFYNSSFWSMFLPIRKNLKIGLGLVNSLNLSEFKATLAHEFGHFSQRSTTLGSYVYTMNKVMFNLVNQHDRWDRVLERWASAGGVFGFFAGITFWLVQQVRYLLMFAYQKLNVRYMALSREMEYHADLVACSVAGSEPLIQTLRKIEFTDMAYNYAMGALNEKLSQKKKTGNLYKIHSLIVGKMAGQYNLPLREGMPVIADSELEKHLVKSRVNVKDQWASHPSREDREVNANKVKLSVEIIDSAAWIVFAQPEIWQKRMTEKLYSLVPNLSGDFTELTEIEISSGLEENEQKSKLPEVFRGFYDDRLLGEFDMESAVKGSTDRAFEEIFSNDSRDFFSRLTSNQNDLDHLLAIKGTLNKNDIFEFDHQKRKASELPAVISNLEKEIEQGLETRKQLDRHAFQYYHLLAQQSGAQVELVDLLHRLFDLQQKVKSSSAITERLQGFLRQLGSKLQWNEKEVNELNLTITQLEGEFKSFLSALPHHLLMDRISEPDKFESYVKNRSEFYMLRSVFSQEGLDLLAGRIFEVLGLLTEMRFEQLKRVVTLQHNLTPKRYLKAESAT